MKNSAKWFTLMLVTLTALAFIIYSYIRVRALNSDTDSFVYYVKVFTGISLGLALVSIVVPSIVKYIEGSGSAIIERRYENLKDQIAAIQLKYEQQQRLDGGPAGITIEQVEHEITKLIKANLATEIKLSLENNYSNNAIESHKTNLIEVHLQELKKRNNLSNR